MDSIMGAVPNMIGETHHHQQIDELLQPVHFDWAEEVEEEMSKTEFDSQEASTVNSSGCGVDDCSGSSHAGIDECNDVPLDLSSTSWSPSSNVEYPIFLGDESTQTQIEVSQEFAWRAYCMHQDDTIHHFNWLGSPMYHYSETSPAVSLFYILADPKVPQPGAELRLQSVLHRATAFIDPVVVYLENGLSDLQVKGHELIRFATGRVFKFYTPHGHWVDDSLEKEDQTTIDDGDFYTYISPNLASGNGYAEICPIRSRAKWAEVRSQRLASARAFSGNLYRAKKRDGVYNPSPLRNEVVYGDVISEMKTSHKTDDTRDPDDNSEEALDSVCELPACIPSYKRPLEASSCSPFREPIKRRHSSFDLRTEFGFPRDTAQSSRDGLSAVKDSSCLHAGDDAKIRSSLDEASIHGNDNESSGLIGSNYSELKAKYGIELEINTNLSQNLCCVFSEEDESGTDHADEILQSDTDLQTTPEGTSTPPTDPLTPSTENAPHFSQLNLDPPIEFLSTRASDVHFVSIGSRGRGSWATLHDWKTKFKKQLHVNHWHEVSMKTRSVLKLERKHQQSSLSRSSSSTYTPKSTSISTPEHQSIEASKFTQEYFSFPTPNFTSIENDFDRKDAKDGHGDATSSSFGSKVSRKARSFCNKIKNGLHSSSEDAPTKRKRKLALKVAKSCIIQFSPMGPYPYYPAPSCL